MALSAHLSQTLSVALSALDGAREHRGRSRAFGDLAPCLPKAIPELLPDVWLFQPEPAPAQPLATRLCGLGPECRLFPVPIPLPGASSWGGTRLPLPPAMGPPPGPGSWQPAGGSLSMLHLFIDRALPQLLFQSPASCRRLIREGGAGSRAQSCHPGLGGNTESPPACPASLPVP